MRLVLVIALFYQIGSFLTFATYERDECKLENGGKGVCISIFDCPYKLKEVKEGTWQWNSSERCGFDNFTEIVCCAQEVPSRIQLRPAALVALGYTNSGKNAPPIRYNCGGSLISYQHVLTSAHCVLNTKGFVPIEVRFGDRDLYGTNAISILISETFIHPKYKLNEHYYDVAIIKLQTSLRIPKYIKPACLLTDPLNYTKLEYKFVTAMKWDATSFGSNRWLTTVRLGIMPNDDCAKKHYSPQFPNGLDDSLICAMDGNTVNRSHSCQFGGGCPLLHNGKVFSITTLAAGCGIGMPGVYTMVYHFLDWIEPLVWPNLRKV